MPLKSDRGTSEVESGAIKKDREAIFVGEIVRPKLNYISEQTMTAGAGRLGATLKYANVVLHTALNELSATTEEVEQNRAQKRREKENLYARQQKYFDSLTASDVMANAQISLAQAQEQYLTENPSGEGYHDFTLETINELSREAKVSVKTPALSNILQTNLNNFAAHNLTNSALKETHLKAAYGEKKLEESFQLADAMLSQGGSADDALAALNPALEQYLENSPNDTAKVNGIRNELLVHSLEYMASRNPELAAANLNKGELYKGLGVKERLRIERCIEASRRDLEMRARQARADKMEVAFLNPNSFESTIVERALSGQINQQGLRTLFDEGKINERLYKKLANDLENQEIARIRERVDFLAHEKIAQETGTYESMNSDQQRALYARMSVSAAYNPEDGSLVYAEDIAKDDSGQPVIDNAGNPITVKRLVPFAQIPLPAKVDKLKMFTTEIPQFQQEATAIILSDQNPANVVDATQALGKLIMQNSPVIGKGQFYKEALSAFTTLQSGGGAAAIRQAVMNKRVPLDENMRKNLEANLRNRGHFSDMFNPDEVKTLSSNFNSDDPSEVMRAKYRYEEEYLSSRGNRALAYANVANEFNNRKKTTVINGSRVLTEAFDLPDSFTSSDARKKFYEHGMNEIKRCVFSEEGRVGNGIKDVKFPEKISVEYNDFEYDGTKGHFFFIPDDTSNGKEFYVGYRPLSDAASRATQTSKEGWIFKTNKINGYRIMDPRTGAPLKIKLEDVLKTGAEERISALTPALEKMIRQQTFAEALDLDIAFGQCYPNEIDRAVDFYV